jgi:hypothetical protein
VSFGVPILDTLPEKGSAYPSTDDYAVYSSLFSSGGQTYFLEDDGQGKMRVMRREGTQKIAVFTVGTIDYVTGDVSLNSLRIDSIDGDSFRIYARPSDADVTSTKNTIFTLEPSEVRVTVEQVRV